MDLDIKANDLEHKFMKERISSVENHFAEISSKLSSYVNKLAGLRDCGDELAVSLSKFASKENFNQSLRLSLGAFSDKLVSIQEYRDAQIDRIQVKAVHELEGYSPHCKKTKVSVKECFDSRVKELKKKNNFEKARSKTPTNYQKITQAEKEVTQAQEEAAGKTRELVKLVEWFERKKLEDIKHIFLDFIKIEMIFHAKALELYSESYNIFKKINVEEDLEEFNCHFLARMSSLNVDASSPSKSATASKVLNTSDIPDHSFQKPETSKGIQRTPRSIFTLKSSMPPPDKLGSSSESFKDPHDLS